MPDNVEPPGGDPALPLPSPDDDSAPSRRRIEGAVSELIRRTLAGGLGALLATEEGIRRIAGELPREAAAGLLAQAQHSKDEVMRVIAAEVRRFLENVDLAEQVARTLSKLTVSVTTEVKFSRNPDELPEVRSAVEVKRTKRDKTEG